MLQITAPIVKIVKNSLAWDTMHSDTNDGDNNNNDNSVQIMDNQDKNVGVSITPIQTTQPSILDENYPPTPTLWGDSCIAKKKHLHCIVVV